MEATDWITLATSLAAFLTAIIGLLYQNRQIKQKDLEIRHRIEMDHKEFIEKYTSPENRMRGWLDGLSEPPAPAADIEQADPGLPYQAGAPLRNADLFYGRQEQLASVLQCVNSAQMASMSILGARKSGKTSFFYQVVRMLDADHYPRIVPVFLDAQSAIESDKHFYAYMLREASTALDTRSKANARPPDLPKEVDFDILATFLEQASKKHWRFVFLLDEFERLAHDPGLSGEDFFASLRSLILKGNVSWIPASYRFVYMPGTNTSPFVNILQESTCLGPLSAQEAHSLVSEPAARARHPFEAEDVHLILELAGRMPFLLQKAALVLYKLHRAGVEGQAARTQLMNTFRLEAQSHFQSQFAILSAREREALHALATGKGTQAHENVLGSLERYGFVERDRSGFKLLGRTFEEYVYQKAKEPHPVD